eukprot:gene1366-2749_t
MWECPLPAAPDGSLPDIKLPITSVRLPMYAWTDPLATLYIGTEVLKKRGHLDVNLPLSALTIFIRGDGVVDGWTKVYHLSLLVADAEGPRKPNNCLDFVVGDIEETSPLHWSIVSVSAAVLPSLDLMRLQVADTLCVGDGAFLLNVEKGLTHGPNQALNDFRHQGVSVLVCDTDCRLRPTHATTLYQNTEKWCIADDQCHKDDFNWDRELLHALDPSYVRHYGQRRPSSFLGNCHGEAFWDPQHGQKLATGQMSACLGHVVAVKFPQAYPQYVTLMKAACPDWGLGDWLKTKSWTIDEGHALLQNPAILNAVIDHLSPLFPGYQLPDEAGGLFVACPIRLLFRSLRNGFACLLSDWETAVIQTADEYESNWKMYRLGVLSVFHEHKEYVRGAWSPSLHWFAVHSAKVIRRFWDHRGALATGGLERHGKDWKHEFLSGTARRQWNPHGTHGYKTLLRRRGLDWALTLQC